MASVRQSWVCCKYCFAGKAVKSQNETCNKCRARLASGEALELASVRQARRLAEAQKAQA